MAIAEIITKPIVDVAEIGGAIGGFLKRSLFAWQVARMRSVLKDFTDPQLEAIGITREQIPAHAYKLMTDEA
jgi:uncharacterized protein YjiS (DUF1127 family)